jgi:hypothetical protein
MARTGIVAHMHWAVVEKENPLKIFQTPYNLLHGFLLFYPETLVLLTGTPTDREPLSLRSDSIARWSPTCRAHSLRPPI